GGLLSVLRAPVVTDLAVVVEAPVMVEVLLNVTPRGLYTGVPGEEHEHLVVARAHADDLEVKDVEVLADRGKELRDGVLRVAAPPRAVVALSVRGPVDGVGDHRDDGVDGALAKGLVDRADGVEVVLGAHPCSFESGFPPVITTLNNARAPRVDQPLIDREPSADELRHSREPAVHVGEPALL